MILSRIIQFLAPGQQEGFAFYSSLVVKIICMEINITLLSGNADADPQEFQVEVSGDDNTKTTHRVTVFHAQHQRLTGGLRSAEEMVKASFEFLLERESKEQILKSFDLSQIKTYFPEYDTVISAQLAK